ncbi:MAG: type II secretion system F family protein [Candidatus Sericytochromatia bacterium]|nr:type II secretion system F family protein [Candidatus Sericytochromatia bacterium]
MPKLYEYTAHAGNAIRKDTIEAENEKEVRAKLREMGLFPLEVRVAPKKKVDLKKLLTTKKGEGGEDGEGEGAAKKQDTKPEKIRIQKKKTFVYTATPFMGGAATTGEIVAVDERQARQLLRDRSMFPTKLAVKQFWHDYMPGSAQAKSADEIRKQRMAAQSPFEKLMERLLPGFMSSKKVPTKDIVFYTSQMATMMDAGLSIAQTLEILGGSVTDRRLLIINQTVLGKIFEGISLTEAFSEHKEFLPDVFCELIQIGEQSGNIEETTKRLAEYLEKTAETQQKVKSAMTYPTVMLVLISLIVLGLMLFVVPTFIKLFDDFKLDLPGTTKFLIASSKYVQNYWWTLPLYAGSAWWSVNWFRQTNLGLILKDRFEYRVPILGNLNYKVVIGRLLYNMALFMRCGVPLTTTLESLRDSTRNAITASKIEDIRQGIIQGARLSTLFEASALFPPFVNHLLVAGEESGALDDLMMKGAKYVDSEIEAAIKSMMGAIEPAMTVVIAGVVIFILGSLYMPLIGLMSNTNKAAQ